MKIFVMMNKIFTTFFVFVIFCSISFGQNVPIENYSVNNIGQVELEIQAQADKYYLLHTEHEPDQSMETITSITLGVDGTLIISEPCAAFPLANYSITEHSINNPDDTDGDGIDDIMELNDMPTNAPLNFADEVPFIDGTTSIDSYETFAELSVVDDNIPWAPFLNNQEFAKFAILNQDSDEAEVYFINTNTHDIHFSFLSTINTAGADIVTGEIVYNPNDFLPGGVIGSYTFNYSFGDAESFEHTRRTFELLVANMPYLQNNIKHFISTNSENEYLNNYQDDYDGSRIEVVLESDYFSDVDYIPFHEAEGFGYFRHMSLDENPGSRDIVLYDALPNTLPRVGGIITSVVQTPLSHVNLRAIQDNVPNAYIKDPLDIDSIANLLENYIYYRVEEDNFFIREATLEEVNEWYENVRPTEEQIPVRDLSITEIMPLDSITFDMSSSFGAKCSNVATMRTFGFPEGTIPDGFGIPFYFYDEFMKFNDFYQEVEEMINDPDFISDLETRIDMLKEFRKDIKDAPMPQWMMDALQTMHDSFPEGTAVRCRSSTNNEDLPGFSGAGLYTSKTQHLDEGHISKSIKQVYASMWNFRAYEERDFYRVDHYIAAMGVLCHPNFEDEKSNGVGVSIDPVYSTENTFYLNTQVGEDLITNPDANSIPEEILLYQDPDEGYFLLRASNLVNSGELVMEENYLDLMREYLQVIHDEFAILYNVVGIPGFGMDIEYKVTAQDQLVIKQARPWVSFWANIKADHDLTIETIVEPTNSASLSDSELVTARVANAGLRDMYDFNLYLMKDNQLVDSVFIGDTLSPQTGAEYQFTMPQDFSTIGEHEVTVYVVHPEDGYSKNDTLTSIINKLYLLEGGIDISQASVDCNDELIIHALVTNFGEATFTTIEIEVVVNGVVVDTFIFDNNIQYEEEESLTITTNGNLNVGDNEVQLNLISVNGQVDAVNNNNSISTTVNQENSTHDIVTLIINADNYPAETSWTIVDELTNETVASGELTAGTDVFTEDICVDYSSCLTLNVFDSFGDGICCGFGEGNFMLQNSEGETLVTNDGDFGSEANEFFCPNEEGCSFTAEFDITIASDENTSDGSIAINTSSGFGPFQYSINGGQSFVGSSTFSNLAPGGYDIVIMDANDICSYEETVEVEYDMTINTVEFGLSELKVYPNPTEGDLVIEWNQQTGINGFVNIQVYDCLGRLLFEDGMNVNGSQNNKVISLGDYTSGVYYAKCFYEGAEKTFKIFKF